MNVDDYIRGFAADIGLNPPVNGFYNVQDALGDAATPTLNLDGTLATADTPTTVTCDGSPHNVDCITASPPDWFDDAGNIIAPGQYVVIASVSAGVAATTPGLYVSVEFDQAGTLIPIDALALDAANPTGTPLNLQTSDLPTAVSATFITPNDVTATVVVTLVVQRLLIAP